MKKGEIIGLIALLLIGSLVVVTVNPILSSSPFEEEQKFEQKIGDTDIIIRFDKQLELFTNKEKFFRIRVNNTGENDFRYYTELKLVGPEGVKITSWGKTSFSISPEDYYEFIFLLEGLKPGTYELKLSVKEDFYASITLIEDVLRLGILGLLPSLRGLMPDVPGMLLPFGTEMFLYLIISDMWAPFLDRGLTLLAGLPTIATSITYSLMRELSGILLPASDLLSGTIKDLPSTVGEWIRSLPETIGYFEEVLINGPSYSLTHLSSSLTEGWPVIIEKLPKTLDGILELLAYMRFWGPNTAAIILDNLREIWAMENVSLATHLTADAVCLGLATIYMLGTPIGLVATPLYELYHNRVYPSFERLCSSVYRIASPIFKRIGRSLSRITIPLGKTYGWVAEAFVPPLFSSILVPSIEAIIFPLAYPLEELMGETWEGISQLKTSPAKLARVSNEILSPRLANLSDWLWEKGAEYKPVPLEAERGEATFSIEVRVKDMGIFEGVKLMLEDIWETTVGTIRGLATGEY
jgi:hypothetical protein